VTFEHRAGIIPYTSSFELAENCVFSKQSVGPLHCGQPKLALLLANVRSEFAEFLNQSSLAHLRILSSPTCVSFSTVSYDIISRRDFLDSVTSRAHIAQGV
jgi:hypothetical protein